MSDPKTNVPKFTSFRPKSTTAAVPEVAKAEKSSERKHPSRGNDETRDKDHKRRHHERLRSKSRERSPLRKPKIEASWPRQTDDSVGVFVVDRKGDEKNLIYGSIHRYGIPPFHRYGAGHVLGAPPDMKIDRGYGDERGLVLSRWRDFRNSFRQKYVFSKIERERPRLLRIRTQVETVGKSDLEANFIPLQSQRGKKCNKAKNDDGDGSASDRDERDYRSIYGKTKSKDQPIDEDLEYATESDSSGSEAGRSMKCDLSTRQKNIELSRKVDNFPHDMNAWIALIDHQDVLIRAQDDRRRITNAEIRSTADIKIHMYEKALEKARSLKDRERLLLGLMKEGEKIWEVTYQAERWEQISKDNIDSLLLWTSYLNFKQTAFSRFRHEDIKEVFSKRINFLSKAALGSEIGDSDSLYHQLIYLLLRFTLFLRESGYSELAMSIWQGLLELNFFAPDLRLSQAEAIKRFSAFWESEVPRIGENGALGWRCFVGNENSSEAPHPFVDEAADVVDSKNLFKSWAAAERLRTMCSRAPARTMDEVTEDDPFRVILFSDIEDFLIHLPTNSPGLRKLLLDGILLFCRLPAIGSPDHDDSKKWPQDAFVGNHLLEYDIGWIREAYFLPSNEEIEASDLAVLMSVPIPNLAISSEALFGPSYLSKTKPWKELYAGDLGPVSYQWVRNTLKQLTETRLSEDFAEYYLAFEFLNEPLTIKKISKSLLKQHPTNLRLYNSYALIEWSRGNKDVSRGVFSAALNLRGSVAEKEWDRDSIMLWISWIWACLTEQDNNTALRHLLSIADGTTNATVTLSPALLLRAKQHLTSQRDYLISSGNSRSPIAFTESLMLLGYLTGDSGSETKSTAQGDISSALDICTSFSETLVSKELTYSVSHELLLQSAARLLVHHARIGPFRPALIREHLTRFLNLFPQNTMFLSLYTWNESRLRIDNRVRNMLLSTVLTPENDTLTSRLFAIRYEIQHGTIHSVRSAFEHALSSPACKSSADLWRFYILYCLETSQFSSQAKDIWYRAIKACPWAKEIYMIGFEKMCDVLPFSELKSIWRIMGEKDLRVHVDLQERFEGIAELEKATGEQRQLGYK